jgi:hypothetical protein
VWLLRVFKNTFLRCAINKQELNVMSMSFQSTTCTLLLPIDQSCMLYLSIHSYIEWALLIMAVNCHGCMMLWQHLLLYIFKKEKRNKDLNRSWIASANIQGYHDYLIYKHIALNLWCASQDNSLRACITIKMCRKYSGRLLIK